MLVILPDVYRYTKIELLISKLDAAGTSLAVVLNAGDYLIIYDYI